MKLMYFKEESTFLRLLDGKVYCIADELNKEFLCDILEEDFITLTEAGIIVDYTWDEFMENFKDSEDIGGYSDYRLAAASFRDLVLSKEVCIHIENEEA